MTGSQSSVTCLAALVVLLVQWPGWVCSQQCPWDDKSLVPWSRAWPPDEQPGPNDKVVIRSGTHVLLTSSVTVRSVTIEPDATLVWGNIPDLHLKTGYILIHGAFIMGSRACRLRVKANITLTGLSNGRDFFPDPTDRSQMRKVIYVAEKGTLEIHGRKKTPWVRLAQTMPSMNDLTCTAVYDHSDQKANPFAVERGMGLHVIVWNENGTVVDFNVYIIFTKLREFIELVPAGKVIAMYAYSKVGLNSRKMKKLDFETLDDVIINQLGGRLISKVNRGDSYSLITVKGSPTTTLEHYMPRGRIIAEFEERYLQIPNWKTKLAFQVAKSARTTHHFFRVLPVSVAYPVLELDQDVVGWGVGDKIVVASTDYDWEQLEVREIIRCGPECSNSQIRVNESFRYRHFGNFTYLVDERGEVGLLTRNILIQGEMEDHCYFNNPIEKTRCDRFGKDTFGGHIKVVKGHAAVHVQGVELYHMGQQGVLGTYPMHFHMCDEAKGSSFKESSIHHSFQRCVTVHGTDYVEVSGNVCYDHLGHGFFLEDSAEQNNVLNNNLGLGTKHGATLMSDMKREWCARDIGKKFEVNCDELSTFWITHPNNEFSNNAAAGGDGHGFMYVFSEYPLSLSRERQEVLKKVTHLHARRHPIKKFYNNVAHSYYRSGLFFDSVISTGRLPHEEGVPENGIIQEENYYEPRDPPGDKNGRLVWTKIERFTSYKNGQNNVWLKGGNINVTFSSFADSAEQSFSGGTTGFWTGTSMEYCVFIGRTQNLGEPRKWTEEAKGKTLTMTFPGSLGGTPWSTVTGVGIYQGPMFVKHSYFDRFGTHHWNDSWTKILGKRPTSYGGAISFKKDGTYPTYSSQYTTNLTFGYCDGEDNKHWMLFGNSSVEGWMFEFDGPRNAYNLDKDGSLTGTPNTVTLNNRPFFTGPECLPRPDWGEIAVCPYRYIKVEILGKGGNLGESKKEQWPLICRRDDKPNDHFCQQGKQRREYLTRTYKSYLVDFNTTMKGAAFPSELKIRAYGVEKQDMVRMGICVPRDLRTFDVAMEYPVYIRRNNYTTAKTLKELDDDNNKNNLTIFHDKENGIIFFKIWSLHDRTNDSQLCTGGECYMLKIFLKDGTLNKIRSCFNTHVPPYKDLSRPPPVVRPAKKCFGVKSPQGLGAVRFDETKKIIHKDFNPPCGSPPKSPVDFGSVSVVGCFVASQQSFVLSQSFKKSMTIQWCIHRCHMRKFKYAGLVSGSFCMCGQTVNTSAAAKDIRIRGCTKKCTGDPTQNCGEGDRLYVWTTGFQ